MTATLSQRVKGQETTVLWVRGGNLETSLVDNQDFEFSPKLEIKEQGYLGEKTNRHDEIYNGVKFNGTMHIHTQDFFNFQQAIVKRAKRQTPDVQFNITDVLDFPNGQTPSITVPDAKFGEQPVTTRSRGDYVTVKVQGAADDYLLTTS